MKSSHTPTSSSAASASAPALPVSSPLMLRSSIQGKDGDADEGFTPATLLVDKQRPQQEQQPQQRQKLVELPSSIPSVHRASTVADVGMNSAAVSGRVVKGYYVKVAVISAKGLRAADHNGKSDPYVRIIIGKKPV